MYTNDDLDNLEALVKSPAFQSLKRVLDVERQVMVNSLIAETNHDAKTILQGRIQGMNFIENVPMLKAKAHAEKKKKKADQ